MPALAHFYHLCPSDVEALTMDEITEFTSQLSDYQSAIERAGKGSK